MVRRWQTFRYGREVAISVAMVSLVGVWLPAGIALAVPAGDEDSGFVALTGEDGRDHWLGYGLDAAKNSWPKNWELADGVLHTIGGGTDLKTREEYSNFDLRFEWKVSPGANSGVMYRVSQTTDPAFYTGPEYQIIDNPGNEDGKSADTSAAAVYALYAPTKDMTKPAGEWNNARIVVSGDHVDHYLNGERVVQYDLGSDDWQRRVASSKFAQWKEFGTNRRGHVVLQDHGYEVWYRNVRIKSLDGRSQGR